MKLVIIAAGAGTRISSVSATVNKTLLQVGGRAILDYLLENARRCGLDGALIVTGYQPDAIEAYLEGVSTTLSLETVHNPFWRRLNGLSVLAAEPLIAGDREFMVTMSDHLFVPGLLRAVLESSLADTVANVGLDFNIEDIFDLPDGMKVAVEKTHRRIVTGMSKSLPRYDAIDCGVFKCRTAFFDVLRQAGETGDGSLAAACNLLIPERKLGGVDIGEQSWIDIDTPEAIEYCRAHAQRYTEWGPIADGINSAG